MHSVIYMNTEGLAFRCTYDREQVQAEIDFVHGNDNIWIDVPVLRPLALDKDGDPKTWIEEFIFIRHKNVSAIAPVEEEKAIVRATEDSK